MELITSLAADAFQFIGVYVIGRYIFAPWLAEKIKNWLKHSNDRNAAIWQHYATGHNQPVAECHTDTCSTL